MPITEVFCPLRIVDSQMFGGQGEGDGLFVLLLCHIISLVMKVLVSADLHYDIARSRGPAEGLIAEACDIGGDAIVLVGDTAGARLGPLADALDLLNDFGGRKLMVPGNHCLWCRDEDDSLDRYERIIPELAGRHGFEVLDTAPVVCGPVGFVGSVGWYDYSFADEELGIPKAFYEAKVSPGAASQMSSLRHLLSEYRNEISDRALALRARWMDGRYVKLPMSDLEFCQLLADKLAAQLADLAREVDRIVAFMHHLPFAELVPKDRPDRSAFAAAYLGSGIFGRVLLACPKVTHIYCGHSHWHGRENIGGVEVVNVGSTYTHKRLEILEI